MAERERWLVTGASGQLGGHLLRQLAADALSPPILALAGRGEVAAGCSVRRVDLADLASLRAAVRDFRPSHVLHCGALTSVSRAHQEPELAEQINVRGTAALADAVATSGGRLVFTSTDMVFDGEAAPYHEADAPRPITHYGRTKYAAELEVLRRPGSLVVRIPLLYGCPSTRRATTFVQQMEALRARQPLSLFTDEFRTPLWLVDAARALLALARSDLTGVIHVAGPERLSRYELIARCAALLGVRDPVLVPASRVSAASPEPRPADLSLAAERFVAMFPQLAPGPLRPEALTPPYC